MNKKELVELGKECGLYFTGEYEEDLPVFVGDNKAWDLYNKGGK